jgi:threonine/homoserine/homoserine lactone efflux protein
MGPAIGASLPIAVGVLVSPMPIVAVVLMLVSRRARSNGFAFLVGWMLGIAVLGGVVVLLVGSGTSDDADAGPATWASVVKLVLGLLLLLLAVKQWSGRPRDGATPPTPGWMSAIDSFTAVKAFGLAVGLGAVNPKNLLLVVAGATTIAQATSSTGERLGAMLVFVVIASIGVAAPLVVYLSMGARAARILDELRTWMTDNNATIMAVLLLVIAAKLVGDAIAALT